MNRLACGRQLSSLFLLLATSASPIKYCLLIKLCWSQAVSRLLYCEYHLPTGLQSSTLVQVNNEMFTDLQSTWEIKWSPVFGPLHVNMPDCIEGSSSESELQRDKHAARLKPPAVAPNLQMSSHLFSMLLIRVWTRLSEIQTGTSIFRLFPSVGHMPKAIHRFGTAQLELLNLNCSIWKVLQYWKECLLFF